MPTLAVLDVDHAPDVFGIDPIGPRTLAVAAVNRAARVAGPSTVGPPLSLSQLTCEVQDVAFAAPYSLVNARSQQFQDTLSEAGSGSFVLQNDDADNATLTLDDPRFVTFRVNGAGAWTMLVEAFEKTLVGSAEDAEATKWSGRGHLAYLERGVVYPSRGVNTLPIEEDRLFNWTSPVFDDSAWGHVHSPGRAMQIMIPGGWGSTSVGTLVDRQFPDWDASALWPSPGTAYKGTPGDVYFRQSVTIVAQGTYTLFIIMDNTGEFYVDGTLVGSPGSSDGNGFHTQTVATVDLSPGTHTFAAHVLNIARPTQPYNADGTQDRNPGMLMWALYPVDATGAGPTLVDYLPGTHRPIPAGNAIAHSDSTCRAAAFPASPPGMTPGQVIRIALEEAQGRGALAGVALDFTDDVDSNGSPWPNVADIATKVGNDLLTFYREIAGTYVDLWMQPGSLTLSAYRNGTMGSLTGVTFHPPTDLYDPSSGNLTALTIRGGS